MSASLLGAKFCSVVSLWKRRQHGSRQACQCLLLPVTARRSKRYPCFCASRRSRMQRQHVLPIGSLAQLRPFHIPALSFQPGGVLPGDVLPRLTFLQLPPLGCLIGYLMSLMGCSPIHKRSLPDQLFPWQNAKACREMEGQKMGYKVRKIKKQLALLLNNGPRREREVREAILQAGYAFHSYHRARRALHVQSIRCGFGPGGYWELALPGKTARSLPGVPPVETRQSA